MLISSEFELNKTCRTCLSNGEMLSLYEERTTEATLAEMLTSCTSVNYNESDGLAAQVCLECVSEINRSYKFSIKCKESNDKLQKYLQNNATPASALLKNEADEETGNARHNRKENKHINNAYAHESYNNTPPTVHIRNDLYEPIPTVENKNDLTLADPLEINQDQNISTENMRSQFPEINTTMLTSFAVQNQDLKRLKNEINCDHQIEQSLPVINEILPTIGVFVGVKDENDSEILHSNVDPLEIDIFSEFESKQENELLNAKSSMLPSGRMKTEILDVHCPVCGKKYPHNYSLQKHLSIHYDACAICNITFKSRSGRYLHMQNKHSKTEPVTCAICNKLCVSMRRLKKHMKIHSDEKPFSCLVCDKSFRVSNLLTQHMRSHFDDRSHTCTVCNKSFKHKTNLTNHMFAHKDERSFACTFCNLKFKLKHHLKAHVERKHPSYD